MAQGLQVFNELGNIVFDTNTRTIKVLTLMPVVANMNTTFTHPLLSSANNTPLYVLQPAAQAGTVNNVQVTFNGNVATIKTGDINDTYVNASIMKLIIGVY